MQTTDLLHLWLHFGPLCIDIIDIVDIKSRSMYVPPAVSVQSLSPRPGPGPNLAPAPQSSDLTRPPGPGPPLAASELWHAADNWTPRPSLKIPWRLQFYSHFYLGLNTSETRGSGRRVLAEAHIPILMTDINLEILFKFKLFPNF